MEGSVAAQGAQGAEGADGGDGQAVADFSTLTQTLEGVQTQQQELRDIVSGLAEQLTPGGEGEGGDGDGDGDGGEEFDFGFLEGDGGEAPDSAVVAQRLQALVDQRAQQIVNQRLGPLEQRVGDGERTRALQDLVDDVPDFGNPKIADQVMKATAEIADAYGWPGELKQDPRMYRIVYYAAKAAEIAAAEGDGSDAAVATLEGGGGARPAGARQETDLGDEIVGARKGRSALPF